MDTSVDRNSPEPAGRTVKVQRQTMSEQVVTELRRRILLGELEEGAQLRQEQLATEFGISKVPVREALAQLEAEGFVIQQFHKGAIVAGLSPNQIMEVFELRTQIEVWLIELAMENATAVDVEKAQGIAEAIGLTNDAAAYPELNWKFHEALYKPSKRDFALDYIKKLHAQIERYVRMQFSLAVQKETVVREHAELLRLYAKKDKKAKEALKGHIMGSAKQLATRLAEINKDRTPRDSRIK